MEDSHAESLALVFLERFWADREAGRLLGLAEYLDLWEDCKFDLKHFNDIERLAIVGETKWEKGMSVFCRPFTTAKIKYFDRADLDKARAWISE